MSKFRKKPVVIEAVQFKGNDKECLLFCPVAVDPIDSKPSLIIPTLEGDMKVQLNDWIIKGVSGEFYPCKPDIFAKTYESCQDVDESQPQKEEVNEDRDKNGQTFEDWADDNGCS